MIYQFDVKSTKHTEVINIQNKIDEIIHTSKISDGLCFVFVPHTTAGITINEGADPDVIRDILYSLDKVIPLRDNYHHSEGNSAAHIKASLLGSSVTIFIESGKAVLGTWQSTFFCEFDGPRHRKVYVKIISC